MPVDDDLKTRVLASITSTNAQVRKIALTANPLRFVSDALGFGESYGRLREITDSPRYDAAGLRVVDQYAKDELSRRMGLDIDEISERGLARAIGKRAGFELNSLSDVEIIKADLTAAAAALIAARLGWALERAIRTHEALLREFERRAAGEIEKRVPGLILRDLADVEQVKSDFCEYAAKKIYSMTGCRISDISDQEKTKKEIYEWAESAMRRRLGIKGTGGGLRMTAKAVRGRKAQRDFYARNGDLHVYRGLLKESEV